MARSSLVDPLDKFRWKVTIEGFTKLGFNTFGVPGYTITPNKYPEGGAHLTPRNIVDSIEYNPVTLTRGVTNDTSFNKWANGFIDLVTNNAALNEAPEFFGVTLPTDGFGGDVAAAAGNLGFLGPKPVPSSNSYPFQYRKTVTIEHVNRMGVADVVYTLYGAFPLQYKPASDFDAHADDGVSIDTLVLGYESFDVRYSGIAGLAENLIGQNNIK